MTLYNESMIAACSAKIKKGLLLCILPLAISLALSVSMCFFLKGDNSNATFLHVLNVAVNALIGWFSLSVLFAYVLPCAKRKRAIERIFYSARKQARGTVAAMNESYTVRDGVSVTEIRLDCDGKIFAFYYDEQASEPQFKVGDILQMTSADNFVFSYEVEDDEKEI